MLRLNHKPFSKPSDVTWDKESPKSKSGPTDCNTLAISLTA